MCSLGEGCEDIKKPRAALWKMVRQNPLCIDFRMSGKLGLTKCIVWMPKKNYAAAAQITPPIVTEKRKKKTREYYISSYWDLTDLTWNVPAQGPNPGLTLSLAGGRLWQMGQSSHCCPSGPGFWPAARGRSGFPAACHSGFEAAGEKEGKKWMEGNFRLNEAETTWQRGKCENKDFRNDYHAVPVSLQRWGETGSLFHLQSVKFKWHKFISCQWTTVGVGVLVGFYCTSHWIQTPNERVFLNPNMLLLLTNLSFYKLLQSHNNILFLYIFGLASSNFGQHLSNFTNNGLFFCLGDILYIE